MVGPYSRVIHKLFTYTSAVEVSFGLAALTSSSHAHTHTVHTHTHTNKVSLCSKMVICVVGMMLRHYNGATEHVHTIMKMSSSQNCMRYLGSRAYGRTLQ